MIEDIEKHCINKRLKKNIFKMDCNKYYKQNKQTQDNSFTLASSDYKKLPRVQNDPVIDH
jgi:hypothetical protein